MTLRSTNSESISKKDAEFLYENPDEHRRFLQKIIDIDRRLIERLRQITPSGAVHLLLPLEEASRGLDLAERSLPDDPVKALKLILRARGFTEDQIEHQSKKAGVR